MLQSYFANSGAKSPLAPVIAACRRGLLAIGIASGVINVLTLTGSLFMMQVYDRVIGSQSVPTLVGLAAIAIIAYAAQGALETIRGRMLSLIGEKIDADIGPAVQAAGLKAAVSAPNGAQEGIQVQRDLDAIRNFVGGAGLAAAFDIPWIPIYVIATTLLHPLFGLTTLIAGLFFIWLTWKNEQKTRSLLKEANDLGVKRNQVFDGIIRNSEVVVANGMVESMAARLSEVQRKFLVAQRRALFTGAVYGNAAKTLRMMLQSFVLGLGAYLALKGQISSGSIIGGSIMVARALAPIDLAINGWKPFVAAREGHERLTRLLGRFPDKAPPMALPAPKATFAVRELAVVAPGGQAFAVAGVSFALAAGESAAIIGQSASGKTSLIRAIVGAWKLNRGFVEFDGTSPDQWAPDVLGKSIGYLPQDVQLFDGTIADNISRFDAEATPEKVQRAAMAAGLDGYIRQAFPQTGYNTPLAAGGSNLSGGQRQRIGLARALYGDPFLVVLDEPNSNLDRLGREALGRAIREVKERKGIVIVSAHDHNVLTECDKVLTLHLGVPEFFGPRDEVLKKWLEKHHPEVLSAPQPQAAAPSLPSLASMSNGALATRPAGAANGPASGAGAAAGLVATAGAGASNGSNGSNGSHGAAQRATSWSSGTARIRPGRAALPQPVRQGNGAAAEQPATKKSDGEAS